MQTSIIKHSETISVGRLDAEFLYLQKELDIHLTRSKFEYIGNIATVTDGEHASPIYQENGYICLTGKNVKDFMIHTENAYRVVQDQFIKNRRVLLNKGNILLGIVGTIGNCAVVRENIIGITTRHVATIKDLDKQFSPYYINAFLSCKYGLIQSNLWSAGNVQPLINLGNIRQFKIPLFSEKFQKNIEDMVLKAHAERENANTLTKEAQTLLEKELGIYEWTPTQQKLNISIKKHSDTTQANRIDAEYYQNKYDAILEKITSYKGGYKALGEICHTIEKGIEPGSKYYTENGIPFIRIANLTPYELSLSNAVCLSNEYYQKNKKYQPKQGDVLLSKDGTAGIAYYLYDEPQPMIPSGGILRLNADLSFIKAEVLAFILNSSIVKKQVEQTIGGAIILHWRMDDVYNTIIPILDKKIQDEIAIKITNAHQSRQESKRLLELAKSTVEHAIEHGETKK